MAVKTNIGSYSFEIGAKINTQSFNQAKKQFIQTINEMTAARNKFLESAGENFSPEAFGIKQQITELQKLKSLYESSWSDKFQQLDLSKFNRQLSTANMTMKDFRNSMIQNGGGRVWEEMQRNIVATNVKLKESNTLLDKMGATMMQTIRWGISTRVFNTMVGSIQKAWNFSKELDKSLTNIQIVTQKSNAEMAKMARNANKMAKELGQSTTAYTDAALIFYQQGLKDEQVTARTNTTLKVSNITGQGTAQTADELTAFWNGYKVNIQDTEKYVDKLAATATSSASSLAELSQGMSKVSSTANTLGVSADQLTGQLATVIQTTRQDANVVGTAFKTIYARIADLNTEAGKINLGQVSSKLKEVGINLLDDRGELREVGTVVDEIGAKWQTWTKAQKDAVAIAVAGKRQYNNLFALFENWDVYEQLKQVSELSEGTIAKQNEIAMNSLEKHLQELSTAFEDLYISMFDTDGAKQFIDMLTSITNAISKTFKAAGPGGLLSGLGGLLIGVNAKRIGGIASDRYAKKIEESRLQSFISDATSKSSIPIQPMYDEKGNRNIAGQHGSLATTYQAEQYKALSKRTKFMSQDQIAQHQEAIAQDVAAIEATEKQLQEFIISLEEQINHMINFGADEDEINKLKQSRDKLVQKEMQVRSASTYEEGNTALNKALVEARNIVNSNPQAANYNFATQDDSIVVKEKGKPIRLSSVFNANSIDSIESGTAKARQFDTAVKDLEKGLELVEKHKIDNFTKQELDDAKAYLAYLKEINASIQAGESGEEARKNFKEGHEDYKAPDSRSKSTKKYAKYIDEAAEESVGATEDYALNSGSLPSKAPNVDAKNRKNQINRSITAQGIATGISMFAMNAPAIFNGLKTLGDEAATAADRVGALTNTASSVGMSLMMIPHPAAQVAGSLLTVAANIPIVQDAIESIMVKTNEEEKKEFDEAKKAYDEAKQSLQATIAQNNSVIQDIEKNGSKYEELNTLAHQGMLTENQQTEYQAFISKIKQTGIEINETFDEQGNIILDNITNMDVLVDKIRKTNQEEYKKLYVKGGDQYDKTANLADQLVDKKIKYQNPYTNEQIIDKFYNEDYSVTSGMGVRTTGTEIFTGSSGTTPTTITPKFENKEIDAIRKIAKQYSYNSVAEINGKNVAIQDAIIEELIKMYKDEGASKDIIEDKQQFYNANRTKIFEIVNQLKEENDENGNFFEERKKSNEAYAELGVGEYIALHDNAQKELEDYGLTENNLKDLTTRNLLAKEKEDSQKKDENGNQINTTTREYMEEAAKGSTEDAFTKLTGWFKNNKLNLDTLREHYNSTAEQIELQAGETIEDWKERIQEEAERFVNNHQGTPPQVLESIAAIAFPGAKISVNENGKLESVEAITEGDGALKTVSRYQKLQEQFGKTLGLDGDDLTNTFKDVLNNSDIDIKQISDLSIDTFDNLIDRVKEAVKGGASPKELSQALSDSYYQSFPTIEELKKTATGDMKNYLKKLAKMFNSGARREDIEKSDEFKQIQMATQQDYYAIANAFQGDAIEKFSNLADNIDPLRNILSNKVKNPNNAVDAKQLKNVPDEMKKARKEYTNFINVAGSSASSYKEVKKAADDLLSAYFSQSSYLDTLTGKTKEWTEAQLEAAGVANSDEVASILFERKRGKEKIDSMFSKEDKKRLDVLEQQTDEFIYDPTVYKNAKDAANSDEGWTIKQYNSTNKINKLYQKQTKYINDIRNNRIKVTQEEKKGMLLQLISQKHTKQNLDNIIALGKQMKNNADLQKHLNKLKELQTKYEAIQKTIANQRGKEEILLYNYNEAYISLKQAEKEYALSNNETNKKILESRKASFKAAKKEYEELQKSLKNRNKYKDQIDAELKQMELIQKINTDMTDKEEKSTKSTEKRLSLEKANLTYIEKEADVYADINNKISLMEKTLSRIAKIKEKLSGTNLEKQIDKENRALLKQKDNYTKNLKLANKEYNKDVNSLNKYLNKTNVKYGDKKTSPEKIIRGLLSNAGMKNLPKNLFTYDDEGHITNSQEILDTYAEQSDKLTKQQEKHLEKLRKNVNKKNKSSVNSYNKAKKKAENNSKYRKGIYDSLNDYVNEITKDLEESEDAKSHLLEIFFNLQDNFSASLEAKLNVYIEYKDFIKALNDSFKEIGQNFVNMGMASYGDAAKDNVRGYKQNIGASRRVFDEYTALATGELTKYTNKDGSLNIKKYLKGLGFSDSKIKKFAKDNGFSTTDELRNVSQEEYVKLVQKYSQEGIAEFSEIVGLLNSIYEEWKNAFGKLEEYNSQIIDYYSQIAENYRELNDVGSVLYGSSTKQFYEQALSNTYNQKRQNDLSLEQLDELHKQTELNKNMFATESEYNKKQADISKQQVDLYKNNLEIAKEQLNYTMELNRIASDREMFGADSTAIISAWKTWSTNVDEGHYDKIQQEFQSNIMNGEYDKLSRTYSTNPKALAMIEKERKKNIQYMEDVAKLSEAEVQRQKLLVNLLKAQLELEEDKTKTMGLQLRRDSQGNYSYQYTVDRKALEEQQKAVEQAELDLYTHERDTINQKYENYLSSNQKMKDFAQYINDTYGYGSFTVNGENIKSTMSKEDKNKLSKEDMKELENTEKFLTSQFKAYKEGAKSSQLDFTEYVKHLLKDDAFRNGIESKYGIKLEEYLKQNFPQLADLIGENGELLDANVNTDKILTDQLINNLEASIGVKESAARLQNAIDNLNKTLGDADNGYIGNIRKDFESLSKVTLSIGDEFKAMKNVVDSLGGAFNALKAVATSAADTILAKVNELKGIKTETLSQKETVKVQTDSTNNNNNSSSTGKSSGSSGKSSSSSNSNSASKSSSSSKSSTYKDSSNYVKTKKLYNLYDSTTVVNDILSFVENNENKKLRKKYYKIQDALHGKDRKDIIEAYKAFLKGNNDGFANSLIKKYDTGGYTGTWSGGIGNDNGRLALLHQKELVLNKDDTENFLEALDLTKHILEVQNKVREMYTKDIKSFVGGGSQSTVQNINIQANFPNATSEEDIISAFDTMKLRALQYVNKQ